MMKEKLYSIICLLCFLCSISITANADSVSSSVGTVWFNADGKSMGNDFAEKSLTEELYKRLSELQPGDDTTFTIHLRNNYSQASNWYMTSEIIDSLEEGTASGGGYTYKLEYINNTDSNKDRVLYESDTVGGNPTDNQAQSEQGLREVNQALKEDYERDGVRYFYLDNLARGQGGQIKLKIALDGETQGNNYQDRLADLRMNFAVQVSNQGGNTTTTTRNAPRTGDEHNLLPYYIAMIISGLLFLYFALDAYTDRLYKKGKGRV